MGDILQWVSSHGYPAIFCLLMLGIVGLPIPDETLLVFCGYLIWRGDLDATTTWLTAATGSLCGITLSYVIGRTLGLGVIHRYGAVLHVTPARLDLVHRWFDRIGHWALFVGYYIAGVRHFTAIVAGVSRISIFSFIAYAWTGGLLWVSTFLTLGYYLGDKWQAIAERIQSDSLYLSIALIAAALTYFLIWKYRAKRNKPR